MSAGSVIGSLFNIIMVGGVGAILVVVVVVVVAKNDFSPCNRG